MAEDIRNDDTPKRLTARGEAIAQECGREEESCKYTSATFYIWLRSARRWQRVFIITPILIGGAAGILMVHETLIGAILALVAGFFPAVRDALHYDVSVEQIASLAAEFKSLQCAFRRTANITVLANENRAENELVELMKRMDAARSHSLAAPEWCFQKAKEKIKKGEYDFDVDEAKNG
jgi:hypothetical protein